MFLTKIAYIIVLVFIVGCDPAYSKRFLLKEGHKKPYAESQIDLLGIDREEVRRKFIELCQENDMERYPEVGGIELQCRKTTEISRLHFILQAEFEKEGAYLVLLDFGAYSQSELSKKLEKALVEFGAARKANGT